MSGCDLRRRGLILSPAVFGVGRGSSGRQGTSKAPGTTPPRQPWLILPPTPNLPEASRSGLAQLSDCQNFYAQFGKGPPVLFLHGGLANSNYWGNQVTRLLDGFTVTVMDTRGHGRSPLSAQNVNYRLFARDVVDLLDFLKIDRTAVVGWSDGAITGMQLALDRPDRVSSLYAFGANATPDGIRRGGARTLVFAEFMARAAQEYRSLSPQPSKWGILKTSLQSMWQREPNLTKQQLQGLKLPIVIADGQHDEIIKREETEFLARSITGSQMLIEPDVSHFAMLQAPDQFNDKLASFLTK